MGFVSTPAGWYPDPHTPAPGQQRYWDGTAWTSSVNGPAVPLRYGPTTSYPGAYYGGPGADKFGFGESLRRGYGKYATFGGRATLGEYWWFTLFQVLVIGVLYGGLLIAVFSGGTVTTTDSFGNPVSTPNMSGGSAALAGGLGFVLFVFALGTLLPSVSVAVRRLHDTNKSGWWYWISLVPFIGGIWLLILLASGGDPRPNMYGPPSTRTS